MPVKTRTIESHLEMAEHLKRIRNEVSDFVGNYGYLFKARDPCRLSMLNIQSQVERLRIALDEEYKTLSPTDLTIYYPSREENNDRLT